LRIHPSILFNSEVSQAQLAWPDLIFNLVLSVRFKTGLALAVTVY